MLTWFINWIIGMILGVGLAVLVVRHNVQNEHNHAEYE